MPDAHTSPMTGRNSAQTSLWAAGLFCLALLLIFYQTTWSMVSIWLRSETFAHGFLILPISLWLIWTQSERLSSVHARPVLWVAALMIPPGFVWLLAWLVDVLVVQQLALVAMLVVGVWAILGHKLTHTLIFPLLFLFFAVPMGEALVAPMMEFTATSTVWLIQKTGIPVFREGMYFMLPSGNWSVVEACSGVRYIIASVTLGVLYAYLTYRSFGRRFLFVVVSAIVPVLANTARAYIIVMLGHLSGMKMATGVDHLIYGWVFFGLVIFLLFWLGSFFREDNDEKRTESEQGPTGISGLDSGTRPGTSRLLAATLVALSAAAVWPLLAYMTESRSDSGAKPGITLPEGSGAWRAVQESTWQWHPDNAVDGQVAAYYSFEGQTLGLYIQYPSNIAHGSEVVGSSMRFTARDSGTRVVSRDKAPLEFDDRAILVDQAQLSGSGVQLLAWSWYRIGNLYTSNDYLAKFQEAWASLGFGLSGSYRIVVTLPLQDSPESTMLLLQSFLDEHAGQLDEALNRAMQGGQ